jgi:hypothetical protein
MVTPLQNIFVPQENIGTKNWKSNQLHQKLLTEQATFLAKDLWKSTLGYIKISGNQKVLAKELHTSHEKALWAVLKSLESKKMHQSIHSLTRCIQESS